MFPLLLKSIIFLESRRRGPWRGVDLVFSSPYTRTLAYTDTTDTGPVHRVVRLLTSQPLD